MQHSKCPKVNDIYTAGKAFSGGDQPESYSLIANIQINPGDPSPFPGFQIGILHNTYYKRTNILKLAASQKSILDQIRNSES